MELTGKDADFKIAYDGAWFHGGIRIQRDALAKLFSDRVLKKDSAGLYWLQTPFEKYPVEVEDVPFVIIDFTDKDGAVDFITNMEETVSLGPDRPLQLLRDRLTGNVLPYIEVRDSLYARLGRPVYYNLINKFGTEVLSRGGTFPLGEMHD